MLVYGYVYTGNSSGITNVTYVKSINSAKGI